MKCIIVVNAYINNKSQIAQAERINEELIQAGVESRIVKNIELAKIVDGKIEGNNYDFCVFLDKDKVAARLLEKLGIRLFNSANAIEVCDDKMLTHIALANNDIHMPDCVYAPLCYYEDAQISEELLSQTAQTLNFPLIAKRCYGSLGSGVFLINNYDELKAFENTNKMNAHFYQKFIGEGGEDIRVIVIGRKYVCAMKRKNAKDFRSNIELGGIGENYRADEELICLCEKVAQILQLDYCGIDILTDGRGKRYVCEVNSNAFFTAAENVCGVNIAKKYAEFMIGRKNA